MKKLTVSKLKKELLTSKGYKPRKGKVLECHQCEKEFYLRPSLLSMGITATTNRKFCSNRCFADSLKTNTERKCKNCGKKYYVSKSQVYYRNIQCCSNECRHAQQKKRWDKNYLEHKKLAKKQGLLPRHIYVKHLMPSKQKTVMTLIKKLDKIFSVYIRKRFANDSGMVLCFTCGAINEWKMMDCGHYISRNHKSTRFDEDNCHQQCRKCNRYLSGNMDEYALALQKKYGKNILVKLNRKKQEIKQFSIPELQELVVHYKSKVEELI